MDLPLAEQPSIAQCRLDLGGLREQRDRYRRLAGALDDVGRRPGELIARFSPAIDDGLLAETLAIERRCCEFFRIDYDSEARELVVRVDDPDLDPALDALQYALTPRGRGLTPMGTGPRVGQSSRS